MNLLCYQLDTVDEKVTKTRKQMTLVNSLPKEYLPIITIIESRDDIEWDQMVDELKHMVLK